MDRTGNPSPSHRTTPPALDRLRALHQAGVLGREYGRLSRLLAELESDEDLARAGRLLARLDPDEVVRASATASRPVDEITVVITGHGTLDPLVAPLTAQLARHGLLLRPLVSDFDAYLRDLQDPGSLLYTAGAQLALCVLDEGVVFDEVPTPWSVADVEEATTAKLAQLERLTARYARSGGHLVLNTVPLRRHRTHQLVDHRSRSELGVVWREFNAGLLRLGTRHPEVTVVDLDPLVAEGGPVAEPRLSAYFRTHLGDELLGQYAREIGHLVRARRGATKKVIAVDLDNTLWDGVLGDDGLEGIAAAATPRGEAFGRFQGVLRQLRHQGVLLAVASKNDRSAVEQALREHPDMTLREDDFVRIKANWRPKDANLAELADELNLGLDSFVFVDDSPFETGLVASSLPDVTVVRLDEEPALHVERLLADGWFDAPELTAEDRARTEQYRGEAARRELLGGTGSLEEFLAGLDTTARLSRAAGRDIPRIARLTQRTNQFHLATRRMGTDEVRAAAEDPDHLVLALHAGDRFGDSGLVGALFVRREGATWHLDNALLSCRVFSRGIEQAAVRALLAHARATGAHEVRAVYRPSRKNGRFRDFYPGLGFSVVTESAEELVLRHDLSVLPEPVPHVRMETAFEGTAQP
ncbi:HAD-IIIC family phosphatase [Streptomyces caatingaensis]|uniref:Methoxymalonyl-ACP biosynthesis protein FkbH n=1 Tax=Streptomyces caatingaensis TaxID=1678637 RepID=A0A0K9XBZ0_9ACTN|nr:HAD-IIIC family phosphatase [Streptomyces caatingaensis]KNB50935.1 methoxymalonyl-ACP biosynthesis protein FkbH [Streptomyces caatingaensis]